MAKVDTPRVVIIGAGFGGLRAARAFSGKPAVVTLVDRNNYHLFQPLLYQVATSTLSAPDIAYPVRSTLRKRTNVDFQLSEVKKIDLERRCVELDSGPLYYDDLVLAVGGHTNFYGNAALEERAFGLKDLDDAVKIRNHILTCFEEAVVEKDPAVRRAMLTFVIVGGGPTGVECAGAISELVRTVLSKDYPNFNLNDTRVILIEAEDNLLSQFPAELGNWTVDVLRKKHVDLLFQQMVTSWDGVTVAFHDGSTIPAYTLIWAAGVRAARLLDTLGLKQDRAGRVEVERTLQVPGRPEVFAIGDAAHVPDETGAPLPMLAPVAMQEANAVVENILARHAGQPLKPFTYHDPGTMATVGRNQAVAVLGRWKFHGFLAWLVWLAVHIFQLIGFRNRVVVLVNWFWSYIFYERASRLIGPD